MLGNLWFDLKYAMRLWAKAPGHFAVCTLVVGLSVGLALWASVLAYTMSWKPLPFPESERWISIQVAKNATSSSVPQIDAYTYQEIVKRSQTVDHLGAYSATTAVLSNGHATVRLRAASISPRLLKQMGVAPLTGRLFEADEGQQNSVSRAILSFATWQNYFSGDPDLVGKQAKIDGRLVEIVGVMPKDFFAFNDFEVWFPLRLEPLATPDAPGTGLVAFLALPPGSSPDATLAEMNRVVSELNKNYASRYDAARRIELVPAHRMFTHTLIPVVTMITLIAVAVLLLGCVNIGLVFFARLLERSRELALRLALGSSRWRMLQQCLLESALVMIPGLLLGIALTALGVRWTRSVSEYASQYLSSGRDPTMLAVRPADLLVAVAIAAAIWLLSTLIPSWRIAKQDPSAALGGSGKGVAHSGNARSASLIVGFQVLLSSLVLVVAANLMTAVREETNKPTGLSASQLMLSTYPTVFSERYPDVASRVQYWERLRISIKDRIPGAEAAFATAVPTRAAAQPVAIEGRERSLQQGVLKLPVTAVSENYFNLLGIKLRSGRTFDSSDSETSLNAAVVDEVFAQRNWPKEDAIGKRIQLDPSGNGTWLTIVGVVSAVGHEPYNDAVGTVYRPIRQANPKEFLLLTRLPGSGLQHRAAIQQAAYTADQDLPLHNLQYIDNYLSALDISYTALVQAFSVIAAITVLLAASGLFGLISRFIARRTQEIGIRRALGSSPLRILCLFLKQSSAYLLVGMFGAALGLLIANVLSTSIPNILSHAVLGMFIVCLLTAAVIFMATYLPARRALALEPAVALRYE